MIWNVVLYNPQPDPGTVPVIRTWGPYGSHDDAEAARRRVHFDQCRGMFDRKRTYVAHVEDPR